MVHRACLVLPIAAVSCILPVSHTSWNTQGSSLWYRSICVMNLIILRCFVFLILYLMCPCPKNMNLYSLQWDAGRLAPGQKLLLSQVTLGLAALQTCRNWPGMKITFNPRLFFWYYIWSFLLLLPVLIKTMRSYGLQYRSGKWETNSVTLTEWS